MTVESKCVARRVSGSRLQSGQGALNALTGFCTRDVTESLNAQTVMLPLR